MPKLDVILETAIHTEDMVRARAFYEGVLGWSRSIATTDCPSPALKIFGKTRSLAHAIFGACQTVKLSS